MTVDEVASKLKSKSKEVSNGWSVLDTHGEETFGLNFKKIKSVAKGMECDPCLADELYATSNHDLKVLATFIDDADSYTRDELKQRCEQLYLSPFAEVFCHQIMAKSPHAVHFIDMWSHCDLSDYRCYAYYTLAEVAKHKNNLSDEFYARHLKDIAERIHEEPDAVKEAMQEALISIGCRDSKLCRQTYDVANAIGKIDFNNGKEIDALTKLEKTLNVRKPVKS